MSFISLAKYLQLVSFTCLSVWKNSYYRSTVRDEIMVFKFNFTTSETMLRVEWDWLLGLCITVTLPEKWCSLDPAYKHYPKVINNYLFNQSIINPCKCLKTIYPWDTADSATVFYHVIGCLLHSIRQIMLQWFWKKAGTMYVKYQNS